MRLRLAAVALAAGLVAAIPAPASAGTRERCTSATRVEYGSGYVATITTYRCPSFIYMIKTIKSLGPDGPTTVVYATMPHGPSW